MATVDCCLIVVGRVEELLKLFEESVGAISDKLESAKCIRLSTEDEAFYPDSEEDSDEVTEETATTAIKSSTNNKRINNK